MLSPKLQSLIAHLQILPGVGRKSAQRMAMQLLLNNREGAAALRDALADALADIQHCRNCRTLCEADVCDLCADASRDRSEVCIVETPEDIAALERATQYSGVYFVLMGRLSPLQGIGPSELGLSELQEKLATGEIARLVVATSTTVEGLTTAEYILQLAQSHNIQAVRLAQGIPVGGDLGHLDPATLAAAFAARR